MATLKISDLSVGDWVALESVDLKIEHGDIATAFVEEVRKPICVQSILGEDKLVFARVYHLDGYGTIYAKEEHLRPIPITPEILEKNGFERSTSQFNVYHTDKVWISYDKTSETWSVTMYIDDFTSNLHANILHIHQLQHALRLAGVDKEINL